MNDKILNAINKAKEYQLNRIGPTNLDRVIKYIEGQKNVDIKVNFFDFSKYKFNKAGSLITSFKEEANEPRKILIGVNDNIDKKKQRFSLAHELGHLLLGHLKLDDPEAFNISLHIDYNLTKLDDTTSEENQANAFAQELLMPEDLFVELDKKYFPEELAEYFKVSEAAIAARRDNLPWIKRFRDEKEA